MSPLGQRALVNTVEYEVECDSSIPLLLCLQGNRPGLFTDGSGTALVPVSVQTLRCPTLVDAATASASNVLARLSHSRVLELRPAIIGKASDLISRDFEPGSTRDARNDEKLPVARNYREKYACTRQVRANGRHKVFARACTTALLR